MDDGFFVVASVAFIIWLHVGFSSILFFRLFFVFAWLLCFRGDIVEYEHLD